MNFYKMEEESTRQFIKLQINVNTFFWLTRIVSEKFYSYLIAMQMFP